MAVTLREFLTELQQAECVPRPEREEWTEHVKRISVPGRIAEVTEEEWFYWLEVIPPKFMRGSLFAFAEGSEAARLFWQRGQRFFCRQLTWDETVSFCALAHVHFPW